MYLYDRYSTNHLAPCRLCCWWMGFIGMSLPMYKMWGISVCYRFAIVYWLAIHVALKFPISKLLTIGRIRSLMLLMRIHECICFVIEVTINMKSFLSIFKMRNFRSNQRCQTKNPRNYILNKEWTQSKDLELFTWPFSNYVIASAWWKRWKDPAMQGT